MLVGDALTLPIAASDSGGGATLSYAATGLPAGLSINTYEASTGTIASRRGVRRGTTPRR